MFRRHRLLSATLFFALASGAGCGESSNGRSPEAWQRALTEGSLESRKRTIEELGRTSRPSRVVLRALVSTLAVRELRPAALAVVPRFSPDVVPELLVAEQTEASRHAKRALDVLGRGATPGLVLGLRELTDAPREAARERLVAIGEQAVPPLVMLLRNQDCREIATRGLREIGVNGLPALLRTLNDADPELRRLATSAARVYASPALLPALTKLVLDLTDAEKRDLAAVSIGLIGAPALPLLVVGVENAGMRADVLPAFEAIGGPAIKPLEEFIRKAQGEGDLIAVREARAVLDRLGTTR